MRWVWLFGQDLSFAGLARTAKLVSLSSKLTSIGAVSAGAMAIDGSQDFIVAVIGREGATAIPVADRIGFY